MSLILSESIESFSACLIKSVCKIFDVKVTNTHCCSLAKNDPYVNVLYLYLFYEGRSICNENSPVNPKVLYLHTS